MTARRGGRPCGPWERNRGTTLVEGLVAAAVAAIAAIAMLYALSAGGAAIRSMRMERGALFEAERRLEILLGRPSGDPDLAVGSHGPLTCALPHATGQTTWSVSWVDDALDGSGVGDTQPQDYKKINVAVTWSDKIARSVTVSTYVRP